ncbi:prepilin-type N-terminal cleavage/methylation domain-containing protein [Candidatus Poribacteria bacterium]|nr:prepilin-type N-terminal cleavage/methylation domain-containing protein [Candidatus Poribacteria bacterium]
MIPRLRISRRRGMTFVEMMISVGIFTIVGIFVSYIAIAIARQSRRSLGSIPAEGSAYRIMDRIRNQILPATYGTLTLGNTDAQILFQNPARGTATSSITFDPQTSKCTFDPDTSVADNEMTYGTLQSLSFAITESGRQVVITLTTSGRDRHNDVVPVSYQDTITIRN